MVCDVLRELGAEAIFFGILPDDEKILRTQLQQIIVDESYDLVLLSGGTSKGKGDLNYQVISTLAEDYPESKGILVHGVALKPGKPICVAEVNAKPVVVLPGFPTSAIFTFHEFVAPMVRRLSGVALNKSEQIEAELPLRVNSVVGRTEYLLVDLVPKKVGLMAYPLGVGSGSVSTFSVADGFLRIDRHCEFLPEGEKVIVHPISSDFAPADLIVIGSHCVGLDLLVTHLSGQGFRCKLLPLGSTAGLRALQRGEGDLAGVHLYDPLTKRYNEDFVPHGCHLLRGYGRRQGIVFRPGDSRFYGLELSELRSTIRAEGFRMVNRNQGSGTRILLDEFLDKVRPEGYHQEARSHHAVAAAVAQGRSDWGMTLDVLAREHHLDFVFLKEERFDFLVGGDGNERPAVCAFEEALANPALRQGLQSLGLIVDD